MIGTENTKIPNRSVFTPGSSKLNDIGKDHFNLTCNIRIMCRMFWKHKKCISNAVSECDGDLGMSSRRVNLNWVLSKVVVYVDIEGVG